MTHKPQRILAFILLCCATASLAAPASPPDAAHCASGKAVPLLQSVSAAPAIIETEVYQEPGELSLLGNGLRDFFSEGSGVISADQGELMERIGLLADGDKLEQLRWRAMDQRGNWSEARSLDITWSEGAAHVARIDLTPAAKLVSLELHGAELDFLQIHRYSERPAAQALARSLPLETEPPLDLLATPPGMITRAQWGARNTGTCGSTHNPVYLTVHHTATPNNDSITPAARMRQMQSYHIDVNGWCDFGYHYTVGIDGNLYQGRVTPQRTAAGVGGWNTGNIHVSLVGNFTSFTPRNSQLQALESVSRWLVNNFPIPRNRDRIRGHRDWPGHTSNSCPGDRLYPWLNTLVDLLNDQGPPPCTAQCTPGERRCNAGQTQICVDPGNGCGVWGTPQSCACGEECSQGTCLLDPAICCPAAVPGATGVFADVVDGTWQAAVAERMAELQITAGCSVAPALFCPDCQLPREQAAAFLATALNLPTPIVSPPSFADVPSDSPYAPAIEALYAAGLVSGCSAQPLLFCPSQPMTRAQASSVLTTAGNLELAAAQNPVFSDVPESHWARPAIETLNRNCMTSACAVEPLRYCPDQPITRVQFGRTMLDALSLGWDDPDAAPCCNPQPITGGDEVFVDMPSGSQLTAAARALFDAGITSGCSATPRMFCATCQLDRSQAAALMFNATGRDPIMPATPTYGDVPPEHPFYAAIETLTAAGMVSGCSASPRRFCPDDALTRAQAAAMLSNGLELVPPATPLPSPYVDVDEQSWYAWSVAALHQGCILEACNISDQHYCPDLPMQRQDFALMLARGFRVGEFAAQNCLIRNDIIFAHDFEPSR